MVLTEGRLLFFGWVYPGGPRQFRRGGWFADEALRVLRIGGVQDAGPLGLDGGGAAVVDVGCGVQAGAAVAVLIVVPVLAVRAGGFEGAEAGGEPGPVFECLELGFGVRVVIRYMRAGVGLGDAEDRRAAARRAWTSSRSRGRRGSRAARG